MQSRAAPMPRLNMVAQSCSGHGQALVASPDNPPGNPKHLHTTAHTQQQQMLGQRYYVNTQFCNQHRPQGHHTLQ